MNEMLLLRLTDYFWERYMTTPEPKLAWAYGLIYCALADRRDLMEALKDEG